MRPDRRCRIHYKVTAWDSPSAETFNANTRRRADSIADRLQREGWQDIEVCRLVPKGDGWVESLFLLKTGTSSPLD